MKISIITPSFNQAEFIERTTLNNTFINKLINSYHKNSLNELKKQKIEYFYDLAVRNYLIKNFNNLDIRSDNGHLLENYIFGD